MDSQGHGPHGCDKHEADGHEQQVDDHAPEEELFEGVYVRVSLPLVLVVEAVLLFVSLKLSGFVHLRLIALQDSGHFAWLFHVSLSTR